MSLQENQVSRSRVYRGQIAETKRGGPGVIKLHVLSKDSKANLLTLSARLVFKTSETENKCCFYLALYFFPSQMSTDSLCKIFIIPSSWLS